MGRLGSTGGAAEFWGIEYASVLPPEPPRRRRRGLLAAVGGLGLVAALGAGSVAYATLSGGGPQPESQVPAGVLAYAEVDLDPPAWRKVDLLRLVSRFPRVDATGDDLRAALLRGPLAATGADYDRDVAPWLGDRAAVAVLPPAAGAATPGSLLVLQSEDDAAAAAGLGRLREAAGAELGWVVREGWVLVAPTQAEAEALAAAARTAPLEGDATYRDDVDRLEGDQVVTVWADLVEVTRLAQQQAATDLVALDPAAAPEALPDPAAAGLVAGGAALGRPEDAGRLVLGAGAGPDRFEVEVRGVDSRHAVPTATGDLVARVGAVPDDSVAVAGFSGYGPLLASEWERARQDPTAAHWLDAARDTAAGLGFALPGDLATLLGQEAVVAVGPVAAGATPAVGVRSVGDPATVQGLHTRVAEAVTGQGAAALARRDTADGSVLATGAGLADALAAGGGHLGDAERFRSALPAADDPWMVAYVDLAALLDGLATSRGEPVPEAVRPLASVGMTASTDGEDLVLRLRVGVR